MDKKSISFEKITLLGAGEEALQVNEFETSLERKGWKLVDSFESLNIPEDFKNRVKKDKEPMYVTWAMPFGKSRMISADGKEKGNRYWPREQMIKFRDIIRSENHLVGYKGHMGLLNEYREPAVIWVAAAEAKRISDNNHGLILRGYVFDSGATRSQVEAGAISSASVQALTEEEMQLVDGESLSFVREMNPLSFDFVENGTEGILGTNQLEVSGEQGMELTTEQKQAIAKLTPDVLRELNPALASEMAKNNGGEDVKVLLNRTQDLIGRNLDLQVAAESGKKAADLLGCKVEELPIRITEFSEIRKEAAQTVLTKKKETVQESLKKLVEIELEGFVPTSAEEAEKAVNAAVEKAKKMAIQLGMKVETEKATGTTSSISGETGNTEIKANPIASSVMRSAILARQGVGNG